jgi:hypothetical protein
MPRELFRIVGIRADGSRRILVAGTSKAIAEKTLAELLPEVFAQTIIEPDSDEPTSQGTRSVELFPEILKERPAE